MPTLALCSTSYPARACADMLAQLLGGDGSWARDEALGKGARRGVHLEATAPRAAYTGARHLLLKIRAARLQGVVATAAQARKAQVLLAQAGPDDLVDHVANRWMPKSRLVDSLDDDQASLEYRLPRLKATCCAL